ncbi:MAG: BamA/OMP85 family outer membrane protein, partial [Terriglobia bacterium]
LLAANGYHEARVNYSLRRNTSDAVANVIFNVVPGRPAALSGVTFEGVLEVSSSRLESLAGWKRGMHLTAARVQRGLERIHDFYTKNGRLEATVGAGERVYDAARNTESLKVVVRPGPLLRAYVEGAHISSGTLKKILPIYRDGLTDDLSLDSDARQIENYFERQGYFNVHARWRRIAHPDQVNITYAVDLGPQSIFAEFDFRGNKSISAVDLKPMVTLQPASFPSPMHGLFSQAMLDDSVKRLTALYQSLGFLQVKVSPVLHNTGGDLSVTFDIREGTETRVSQIRFEGVDATTAAKLKALVQALPGRPYSPALLTKDRDAILNYLIDEGHDAAVVTPGVSSAGPHKPYEMIVTYLIKPGPRETIARVVVIGNRYTRAGVIQRQITFKAGQPLSPARLYDSQQRLYNLGLFNSVQIAPLDPGGRERQKTVLVSVEEAQRWTLGYGFGLDVQRLTGNKPQGEYSASPRLSLNLTRINVGGRDQTLSLRGRLSNLETGGDASYLISRLLNHPNLSLNFASLVERSRDVLTFTSTVAEVSLTVEKQYTPSTFLLGRYNFRRVSVDRATLRINPEEIPLVSQPVRDAGFESTFVHDTRDDPTDATRGSYSLLDGSVSADKVGSQADFTRFWGQNSTYYRLGSRLVFARNTQFGVETPYGSSAHATGPSGLVSNGIPLPERFFAGGSDSLRAFSLNQAGPRDLVTGFPIGGNALFVNQLELRFRFHQGRYGVVLFNDAGNVYSSLAEMRLLKFTQSSPTDLNYTVESAGVGLRYKTPIGPIRLDVAYDFNPPSFQLTAPVTEVQQLPRIQYFFSIGQSF